jgi:predicted nucleic acid-binding protein
MTARAEALLDTNILIYATSSAPQEASKQTLALDLLHKPGMGLCAQVLHEFYAVATRKNRSPLSPQIALQWLDQFDAFPSVDLDLDLVKAGAEISMRFKVSYWDGAILAAAHRLGASVLFTEDLQHGQTYGRVRVENPFLNA